MSAGRQVGDATGRSLVRGVVSNENRKLVVEVLWDLRKCFEMVQTHKLADLADDLGSP